MEEVGKMKIGNPLDRDTNHGPQNHLAHLRKLLEYCQRGVEEGATLVCGGKQVPRPGQSPPALAAGAVSRQCLGAVSRAVSGGRPLQSGSQTSAPPPRTSGVGELGCWDTCQIRCRACIQPPPSWGSDPNMQLCLAGQRTVGAGGVAGSREWPMELQELGTHFLY